MNRILLGVLLLLLLSANALAGVHKEVQKDDGAPPRADGFEWVKWDQGRKTSFVEGFLAGSFYMVEAGVTQTRGLDEDKLAEMSVRIDMEMDNPVFTGADLAEWSAMEREYLVKERNETLLKYLVRGISRAEIADGLDAIYKESANRAILIADAIYLAKKKALEARQGEMESLIEYLRQGKKDPTLLRIENDKGEIAGFIQFP